MFLRLLFAIFLTFYTLVSDGWARPHVLVSIKPIHSLVAGVMEGVAEPELLVVDNTVSPHSYALKPSDAVKIERAEIIFWIGESYESFLKNQLTHHQANKTVIKLSESPNLILLPYRKGGFWGGEAQCACECQQEFNHLDHSHERNDIDGHLWLSPKNAEAIVTQIAQILVEKDPDNASKYITNRDVVIAKLKDLEDELHQELEAIKTIPYMLVHDFMNYFDQSFGTHAVGVIRIQPEIEPSVQHMVQVERHLSDSHKVYALFAEPQFNSKRLQAIAKTANVRFGFLDYLGSDLEAGPNCYFECMRQLAAQLKKVLK
jgi:zinc transport system substrate-binding protein